MYDGGMGVSQDYEKAFYWLNKAAEAGNESAMLAVGGYYLTGKGKAPCDLHKALQLFEKASESNIKEISELAVLQKELTEELIRRKK